MYWNEDDTIGNNTQPERLTLTWDVLKSALKGFAIAPAAGLTLTWDVLK